MSYRIKEMAIKARAASLRLAQASTARKDAALRAMGQNLLAYQDAIIEANKIDLQNAKEKGLKEGMIERLTLNPSRIAGMAEGLRQIATLPDPIGEVIDGWKRPNGLEIRRVRTPLGVIGIIYESRPNVTADAAGLCLKSGNACILRGGSEAIQSNTAITQALVEVLDGEDIPKDCIQLIPFTDREAARELMNLNGLVDVLIPRGGEGLIRSVIENASVPVIETGTGNCHTFIDASADLDMATEIVINAKCQRPSVCNAMETMLVHEIIADEFLPQVAPILINKGVEIRGCPRTRQILPNATEAIEEDWATEYNALILAVKVVNDIDQAINHINRYGTKHSEAIITNDFASAKRFTDEVDAACVYVNASTRFTDGYEFGFGAEIGISNQKLHARGPMGLRELTTHKYIIYGDGHIRT
jgi:glutamate-5-semialdehyde dehydrogenase